MKNYVKIQNQLFILQKKVKLMQTPAMMLVLQLNMMINLKNQSNKWNSKNLYSKRQQNKSIKKIKILMRIQESPINSYKEPIEQQLRS